MAKILVVDDSPVERQNIIDILTDAGHTVDSAEGGEAGIALAKAIKPDLIVMDVVMPGMNGFQATRQITTDDETKHIPVVMCTTKGQGSDKMWAEKQGAAAYVVKPVNDDELIAAINENLNK